MDFTTDNSGQEQQLVPGGGSCPQDLLSTPGLAARRRQCDTPPNDVLPLSDGWQHTHTHNYNKLIKHYMNNQHANLNQELFRNVLVCKVQGNTYTVRTTLCLHCVISLMTVLFTCDNTIIKPLQYLSLEWQPLTHWKQVRQFGICMLI